MLQMYMNIFPDIFLGAKSAMAPVLTALNLWATSKGGVY